MLDLVRSELYKLRKEPSFRLLALMLALVAAALPVLMYISTPGDPSAAANGIRSFMNGIQGNMLFLKIALAVLAGFFISREYGSGVMKITGSSGFSRGQLYAAKLTAYTIGIAALALLCPIICFAAGSLLGGTGSLEDADMTAYLLRTLGLTVLHAAAFASIVALFAIATTEYGVTIGVSLLALLFFDTFSQIAGSYIPMYKWLYEHSVFKLFLNVSAVRLTAEELVLSVCVPAATAAAFWWLGILAFRRMEIK